ncbi:MAG: hypothetical protein C4324_01395 [Blastocatellia bacterium]
MDNSNNQGSQARLLIAAALSMLVLFAWSYYFAPKKPVENVNQATTTAPEAATTNVPATQAVATVASEQPTETPLPDTVPNRKVVIKSELYEVTFDSRGALPVSWIILKNKSPMGEYPVFADGSNNDSRKPLELISKKAFEQNPPEVPFRLATSEQAINSLLNERNYRISTSEDTIALADGEECKIEFLLEVGNGLTAKKTFTFRGNSYVADLSIEVLRDGKPVPDTKLAIGASIGDHAIKHHNFYHIESEAVANIGGDIRRHQGNYSFKFENGDRSSLKDSGEVDWVGVGDAYFAMVAIPTAERPREVEYTAYKYEVQTEPFYDSIFKWIIRSPKTTETRHLVTAYIPIAAAGETTRIYTGTKDYFTLSYYNKLLSDSAGRNIDIVHFINFSNYSIIRPITTFLSIPILYALHYINTLTHSYGLAIIIFTFLFYSLLFPLRWSQSRSFKKAAGNAPKMKEIQDKIKDLQKKGVPIDDPRMRSLQMEQLKLTKDALPIGGCLPMILQFPLLIAFYTAITISLDARQASFLWLPDLSAADPWHILEFAFALSMVLAMKFTPTAPAVSPEQQMQQKMMTYLMPVMMLWVMWTAPSGLLLYWLFGNIVSFGQQMLINRMNKTEQPPDARVVDKVPANAKRVKAKLSDA